VSQESSDQRETSTEHGDGLGIADDQLPEDLQPTDENPLAQPADDDVPENILTEDTGNKDSGSGGDSEDAPDRGVGGASDTSSQGTSSETESSRAPADETEDSAGG
jgi:hypothetical protein